MSYERYEGYTHSYFVSKGKDKDHDFSIPLSAEHYLIQCGAEKVLNELRRIAEERTLQVVLDGGYVDLEDIDTMLAAIQSGQWLPEG